MKNIVKKMREKRIFFPRRKENRSALRGIRGFTLIEMLLVVAIIAILVAVSIPLIGYVIEKTNISTDMANERIAEGVAEVNYLLNGDICNDP